MRSTVQWLIVMLMLVVMTGCNNPFANGIGEQETSETKDLKEKESSEKKGSLTLTIAPPAPAPVSNQPVGTVTNVAPAADVADTEVEVDGLKLTTAGGQAVTVERDMKSRENKAMSESTEKNSETDYMAPKSIAPMVIAILLLAGGVFVALYLGRVMLGLSLGCAGVFVFAFITYPWLGLGAALCLIGAGVYYVVTDLDAKKTGEQKDKQEGLLKVLVRSIEGMVGDAKEELKSRIKTEAGNDAKMVKEEVTKIKNGTSI